VNAERPSAVGASKPEPHPEAQRLGGIRRKLDDEAPHGGVWDDRTVRFLVGEVDVLVGRLEQVEKIVDAARRLHHFLEEEKETFEPPRELLDQGYVALETSADYEREEELAMELGEALGVPPPPQDSGASRAARSGEGAA
jgi:hypothetical protein